MPGYYNNPIQGQQVQDGSRQNRLRELLNMIVAKNQMQQNSTSQQQKNTAEVKKTEEQNAKWASQFEDTRRKKKEEQEFKAKSELEKRMAFINGMFERDMRGEIKLSPQQIDKLKKADKELSERWNKIDEKSKKEKLKNIPQEVQDAIKNNPGIPPEKIIEEYEAYKKIK